jgi:CRP-like cAMP-binding protein
MDILIKYFGQFIDLSEEALTLIAGTTEIITAHKGEKLILQGQVNYYSYLIAKGVARGYRVNFNDEVTDTLWSEGQVFNDITTFIANTPATKSYQILEDSVLYRIDNQKFRALYQTNFEICNLGRIIMEEYIVRVEAARKRYRDLDATQRYEQFLIDKPGLIHRVKQKHIASFLGISPETFNRIHSSRTKKE